MSIFGAFNASTTGMRTQSRAFENIGANIANVHSGGYKRIDTSFSTMIGQAWDKSHGYGGVRPTAVNRIDQGGLVLASASNSDVSIGGEGFFILNTQLDGSGDTVYTRDGSFRMGKGPETTVTLDGDNVTVDTGYLVDKNGYYLQGWAANADGSFPSSGTTSAIRIDQFLSMETGQETTSAQLVLNLDSNEKTTGTYRYPIDVYDSNAARRTVHLQFTKNAGTGEWSVLPTTEDAGDTVNSTAGTLTFNGVGEVYSGGKYTVNITWADGATSNFALDMTEMTQLGGPYTPQDYTKNGYGKAEMDSYSFDAEGYITGLFDDNNTRKLYRIPLAQFAIPNELDSENGLIFHQSVGSGEARVFTVDDAHYTLFQPNTRELSNVSLESEFTQMMMTQTAYKASAAVFKTVDEVLMTTRDLKT